MRIVHLVSSGQSGGTEVSVVEMMVGVARAEPAWTLSAITPEPGMFERRLRQERLDVDVRPFPPRFARIGETGHHAGGMAGLVLELLAAAPGIAGYRRRLRASLAATSPDILHVHGFKMQVLGALSMPARARLVWHLHDYVSVRPLSARLLRRLAPRVSLMLANSDSVAADMRGVCGARVPIVTIYNGVDLDRFAPIGTRLDLDALAGLPPAPAGTLRIGLVGTFGLWKGHRTFLRAVARLETRQPVRAYLVGGAQVPDER